MTSPIQHAQTMPLKKPSRAFFSSGPCVKPIQLDPSYYHDGLLGRSHRSPEAVSEIAEVTQSLRSLLDIPDSHYVGLTPGSATGAIEMALWNLLHPDIPIDVLEWDIFSALWGYSIEKELKLPINRISGAVDGVLARLNPKHDCVMTWCGTTHGVWVGENRDFLKLRSGSDGLVFVDAASAVMTTDLPWADMDVTTFSWQKGLGAEAGFGVLVLGPKALERLRTYTPSWAIPRLMRLKDADGIIPGIFRGEMINTCSMLLVAEYRAVLKVWHDRGGLAGALRDTERNFQALRQWCHGQEHVVFSVSPESYCAKGPVTLSIQHPTFQGCSVSEQWVVLRRLSRFLSDHGAGFDLLNHARSFPALRIWCGPATETQDLNDLFPWIEAGFRVILP